MTTVVFCLPGRTFSQRFLSSWTALLQELPLLDILSVVRFSTGANIYEVRNSCLIGIPERGPKQQPFQGNIPYDYIMWIDSDMVFEPKHVKTLLTTCERDKTIDILSAAYFKEGGKETTAITAWNSEYFRVHGKPLSLTREDLKGQTGILSIEVTGMGFMLVRRGVFEKLGYPWFSPVGFSHEGNIVGFTSEDASFCLRAKQAGFSIWLDPRLVIGHEKLVVIQ